MTELNHAFPNTNVDVEEQDDINLDDIYITPKKIPYTENVYENNDDNNKKIIKPTNNNNYLDYRNLYNNQINHLKNIQQQQQQQIIEKYNDNTDEKQVEKTEDVKKETSSSFLLKPITFSLLVVFAFSIHAFIMYFIEHFISATGNFSIKQEIGIRIMYPVITFFLIFIIKSLR